MTTTKIGWLVAVLVLAGCAAPGPTRSSAPQASPPERAAAAPAAAAGLGETDAEQTPEPPTAPTFEEFPGSGSFINPAAARATRAQSAGGDVVLNFEGSDLKEVIKTMLGDILGVNYTVEPSVGGAVTLQTSRPIPREAVIPTLEMLLRVNGAVLVRSDDLYLVLPEGKARTGISGPTLRAATDRGFQYLVVPLKYIAAAEMQKILQPVLPGKSTVDVNAARNLLILGGAQPELETLMQTINVFDVDQMQGMSVGLYRLRSADAKTVFDELQKIFGDDSEGALAGMVRLVVVDRLNALLIVTPQQRYLQTARDWIERLDKAEQGAGRNMYVHPIENGRAEAVAALLQELFSAEQPAAGSGPRSPSPTRADEGPAVVDSGENPDFDIGRVRIIADTQNNALLILATRDDYAKIRGAIRQIDLLPLQVLVEATIVEVSLTGDLSYGLQWFFKNGVGGKIGTGELFPLPVDPSFSYTVTDGANVVRGVLNALASESRLNVLSSPSLVVLDNRTAIIKVGDQVPIRTSETTSLATSGESPLVTSTIQYRDTGVLLEVTPRVNTGGTVVLDITQDVNDVDRTTTSAIDSPTIVQRRITTSVAVESGETVVLGGLIRENKSKSRNGVPFLRDIPVLGWAFGSRTRTSERTELLVLITPTAIVDQSAARAVTEEMQRKMSAIDFTE